MNASEYELMLQLGTALHSSLDLRVAFNQAVPILEKLVNVDHVALAVSRPGTLYDYEWYNATLPEGFLANYRDFADHDFVRNAVAVQPNRVLREHQMIDRRELARNIAYAYAHDAGAKLEHCMAVMLSHARDWSSGLSLYRTRRVAFSDHEAELLQMVVPQIKSAVTNARAHSTLLRETLLEPTVDGVGIGVVWVDASGRERGRTSHATALLEQFFPLSERRRGAVPPVLIQHLRRYLASKRPNKTPGEHIVEHPLCRLRVSYVPMPVAATWALVLRCEGLPPELQAKLTPRQVAVAACLLRGMSNDEIARRDGVVLATVKQQASEIYERLGVDGRNGLLRLVYGVRHDQHSEEREPT